MIMRVYYSELRDHHPKKKNKDGSLVEEAHFIWVSFFYTLFDDILFLIDFFPDSTFNTAFIREGMI